MSETVVVVGGGPAGSFFAYKYLRAAAGLGRKPDLFIIEKKRGREREEHERSYSFACREGCNYCAGGISPRLIEAMNQDGLVLPEEVIASRIRSLTVHGNWKNIELRVPDDRSMFAVFRGSRPKTRTDQYINFDSFLLDKAGKAGARIISGEVEDVRYADDGKPIVFYRALEDGVPVRESIKADFVVFAGGVNPSLENSQARDPLVRIVQRLIPDFSPPRVRKALIGEVEISLGQAGSLEGEIYFVEYGSESLKIEMSSLIPKGRYITVALLGPAVDRMAPSEKLALLGEYLALPQVRRIIPPGADPRPVCLCDPYMTVGVARNPFGRRVAVIGDMAWSRLYKDGIFSAYLTASALSSALLGPGAGRDRLKGHYGREVRRLGRDNAFGKFVFLLNRIVFSNPTLSRVLYQAVLTERKTKPRRSRRLADILWKLASGEATYRDNLEAMFHPLNVASILIGGLLVTFRNSLTERAFGLRWRNFGRFPTGLHREDMEERRKTFRRVAGEEGLRRSKFESMYSLNIKSERNAILRYLGAFGDEGQSYFRPRFIEVKRIAGRANEPGCLLRYRTPFRFLDFQLLLEKRIDDRHLVFRVQDGFARNGILIFNLEEAKPGVVQLSIYVAFDIARGGKLSEKFFWTLFRLFFPGFIHDVLWNHSLCQLKDMIEKDRRE